jgi:aspartate racemase
MKKVGIIGGMGPESTAIFYLKIIEKFQKKYNFRFDHEYPEILIHNNPIPDPVDSMDNEKVLSMCMKSVDILNRFGADIIAIPCNTVGTLIEDIRKNTQAKVFCIASDVLKYAKNNGFRKLGILATKTTIREKYYKNLAENLGIVLIEPSKEEMIKINDIVYRILSGIKDENDKKVLVAISKRMINLGADAIIIGCTDLPLLINDNDDEIRYIDSLDVLADVVMNNSF